MLQRHLHRVAAQIRVFHHVGALFGRVEAACRGFSGTSGAQRCLCCVDSLPWKRVTYFSVLRSGSRLPGLRPGGVGFLIRLPSWAAFRLSAVSASTRTSATLRTTPVSATRTCATTTATTLTMGVGVEVGVGVVVVAAVAAPSFPAILPVLLVPARGVGLGSAVVGAASSLRTRTLTSWGISPSTVSVFLGPSSTGVAGV